MIRIGPGLKFSLLTKSTGKEYLAQLREQGVLPVTEETEKEKNLRRTMAPRRASI